MAAVTSELIKELRERTAAGMLDCKKALTECDGDLDAAIDWLRKKGLSAAAKKSGRSATEGTITIEVSADSKKATISEVNCETDFVGQNENFIEFCASTTAHIHTSGIKSVDELMASTINGSAFSDHLSVTISKIGENIVVRRFAEVAVSENGAVSAYKHANGKIGVLVGAECDSAKTADAIAGVLKDIAMHAAAMNPSYLDETEIPQEDLDREVEVAKAQLEKEGKPQAMWDKIIPGKLVKFKKDNCLVDQQFVKDDKKTVKEALEAAAKAAGGTAKLTAYVRFEVGEGLEKKACDFASEVAAQLSK
ncbi:MAG: translation elongation factor Ts [Campylobacteraceae bacterium]|jgi:elongation factor Ts|nr:translation elongation factor Ts [Campylobacteraceae bacterium]